MYVRRKPENCLTMERFLNKQLSVEVSISLPVLNLPPKHFIEVTLNLGTNSASDQGKLTNSR